MIVTLLGGPLDGLTYHDWERGEKSVEFPHRGYRYTYHLVEGTTRAMYVARK